MANYNKITKITDLSTLPGLLSNAQVLLAHNKKNYKTSLDNINQTRIENIIQIIKGGVLFDTAGIVYLNILYISINSKENFSMVFEKKERKLFQVLHYK